MYYNITDGNNIDWMKAFHMVNVYRDRKVKFRMKLFKKLKEKMNRYLERVAKENNELFDGGVPDCCKLNQKQNLKKK